METTHDIVENRDHWGTLTEHDDVINWKHFPRYWPFMRGIHRSPVNSPHKGHWRGALMFSLICAWINGWVNNREAGDLRRHRAHCDVTVMDGHCHVPAISLKLVWRSCTHRFHIQVPDHQHWLDLNIGHQDSTPGNAATVKCLIVTDSQYSETCL